MDSKGDVRQFFWFASGFPRPDFEMISERVQTSVYLAIVYFFVYVFLFFFGGLEKKDCFSWIPKITFGSFSWLVFRKPLARTLARILLLFEAFASGFPRPDFEMISERVQTSVYLAI